MKLHVIVGALICFAHSSLAMAKNKPPVIENIVVSTSDGRILPIVLKAVDPENDPVTFKVDGPLIGQIEGSGNSFTYYPQPPYQGTDAIYYIACDKAGACSPKRKISVNVTTEGIKSDTNTLMNRDPLFNNSFLFVGSDGAKESSDPRFSGIGGSPNLPTLPPRWQVRQIGTSTNLLRIGTTSTSGSTSLRNWDNAAKRVQLKDTGSTTELKISLNGDIELERLTGVKTMPSKSGFSQAHQWPNLYVGQNLVDLTTTAQSPSLGSLISNKKTVHLSFYATAENIAVNPSNFSGTRTDDNTVQILASVRLRNLNGNANNGHKEVLYLQLSIADLRDCLNGGKTSTAGGTTCRNPETFQFAEKKLWRSNGNDVGHGHPMYLVKPSAYTSKRILDSVGTPVFHNVEITSLLKEVVADAFARGSITSSKLDDYYITSLDFGIEATSPDRVGVTLANPSLRIR